MLHSEHNRSTVYVHTESSLIIRYSRGCQFIHEHYSLYNSPDSFFGRNCRIS